MIIDFSAHYMGSVAKMVAAAGNQFWYPPESDDVEKRLKIMGKYGVDMQVLSQATPILSGIGSREAAEICKASNDSIHELCEEYPDKFVGLAIVSLLDVEGALEELDRAVKDLGLRGVTIATNQNGTGLDSPSYAPFYDRVTKYDIPIFLHPTNWSSYALIEGVEGFGLMIIIGWPFDTTQALCRLIFGKVLENYPSLKIVTHHLGGFFPYSRVETFFEGPSMEILGLKKPLAEYLKQIYGDTALSGMGKLRKEILSCGYAFFGSQRIVFGTDYPFGAESGESFVRDNLKPIKDLKISEEDKSRIFEKNAKRLLKIN